MMEINIRIIQPEDFPAAAEIARQAFNRPQNRLTDLASYVSFQPDGWFLAEAEGEPAGMVGGVDYGPFASIGMMVVRPDLQRMGIGRRLMDSILQWLTERECPVAILEATPAGQSLYASLGFDPMDQTLRYCFSGGTGTHGEFSRVLPLTPEYLPALFDFDRTYFGADRQMVLLRMIQDNPDRCFTSLHPQKGLTGYVICTRNQVGPWVSSDADSAGKLLAAALSLPYDEEPSVIIPAANLAGKKLLESSGFTYINSCTHMVRGAGVSPVRRQNIFGEASLALG